MLFSFEGAILQRKDPVTIAKWTHLNSYRTQKLSTSAAKIVGLAPANIARCRVLFFMKYTKLNFQYFQNIFINFLIPFCVFYCYNRQAGGIFL